MIKQPLQPQDKYVLRLPDGMRDRLKSAAEANGRSMNSEIVLRLQAALDRQEDGMIAIWLPPEVLARVHLHANLSATDPNLLILDAVEKAYPPKPGFRTRLNILADEAMAEGMTKDQAERFLSVAYEFFGEPPKPEESKRYPWQKD